MGRRRRRHACGARVAAAAVREASLAIRAQPQTSQPWYWAGFVLVGDGDVRSALRRRPAIPLLPTGIVGLAIVIVAAALRVGRRAPSRA